MKNALKTVRTWLVLWAVIWAVLLTIGGIATYVAGSCPPRVLEASLMFSGLMAAVVTAIVVNWEAM